MYNFARIENEYLFENVKKIANIRANDSICLKNAYKYNSFNEYSKYNYYNNTHKNIKNKNYDEIFNYKKNNKTRLLVKSKIRFITFLIILFIGITSLFNMFVSNGNVAFGDNKYKTDYETYLDENYLIYEVQSGDTLWSIAKKYGNKKNDVRRNVHIIATENNIDNSNVKVGDILKISI